MVDANKLLRVNREAKMTEMQSLLYNGVQFYNKVRAHLFETN